VNVTPTWDNHGTADPGPVIRGSITDLLDAVAGV
jgi:hypothetical protein